MSRTFRGLTVWVAACVLIAGFGLGGVCGCNVIGPTALKSGRGVYGEAINETNNQQMLRSIVKNRYEESTTLLAVTSVTANFRVAANAGVNAGFGSTNSYRGNLVPLSAGVAYEENPTISYVPVETPVYFRLLLSPIRLEEVLILLRSLEDRVLVAQMLLERVNGQKNPLQTPPGGGTAAGFARIIEILDQMLELDVLEMVSLETGEIGILFQLDEIKEAGAEPVLLELFGLLELSDLLEETRRTGVVPSRQITGENEAETEKKIERKEEREEKESQRNDGLPEKTALELAPAESDHLARAEHRVLVIPARFSAVADGSSIAMTTRSVYDLLRVAASSVDIPEEHLESGMVSRATDLGLPGRLIEIKRSKKKPKGAFVSTRVHDWWFYIDDTDRESKVFFSIMSGLWTAEIARAKGGTATPVLTVPVSR